MTDRDQLLFVIAFALKCKARLPSRLKNAPPLDVADYKDVARVVVEHLEASGYVITAKPLNGAGPGLHGKT